MTTTYICIIAVFAAALFYFAYRLKRRFDKRCPECRSLRTSRKHSMVPAEEGIKLNGPGVYETVSISTCHNCGNVWLYCSTTKFYPAHEIIWRRVFHADDFLAHDESVLLEVLGMSHGGTPITERIVKRNEDLRLSVHPSQEFHAPATIKVREQ